jgi:translation elongation factor P/translation initiation factor 5A
MKMRIQILGIAALLPAAVLTLSSCSTEPKGEGAVLTATQPGEPGGVIVETYQETATVTDVDKATRKVTLVTKDGTMETVKAGPEVANFDQIQVGDQVKVTVVGQLVVFMRKPGEPSGDGAAAAVALAPLGAKPGAVIANTVEITAKVESIDVKHQKATLLFPDGSSHVFKVRKDVDLTKQSVGAEVVIRVTEALAISVEKP